MKKGDFVLIFLMLFMAGALFCLNFFGDKGQGGTVTVTIDGEVYGNYDMAYDQEIVINEGDGNNRFEIKDGVVTMMEANCPDQYCVKHAPIHKEGETIVCLPNKVVLEITESDVQRDIDA